MAAAATERPKATPPTNVVATRDYQPLAPVGSANGLKSLLETQRDGIAMTLPKHVTPERLIKTMLVAVNRIPDLLRCTQASVLETINRAAELGLDLSGTLGEAYPVPFNNKVKTGDGEKWVMQCQLIIGYRGLEKLAWQSGEVESIDAEVVHQNDTFVFSKGTEVRLEWSPAITQKRGPAVGAYACVKLKTGGKLARFLTLDDIEKIRNSSKSKDSPAWRNWWEEMARKCALKRTLKDAPLSTEKFVKAMEHDSLDYHLSDVLAAETLPAGVAGLKRRFASNTSEPKRLIENDDQAQQLEQLRQMTEAKRAAGAQADQSPADPESANQDQPDSIPPAGTGAESQIDPASEEGGSQAGPDLSSFDKLQSAIEGLAMDRKVSSADCNKCIGAWLVSIGKKGKAVKTTQAERDAGWEQAVAGGGSFESFAPKQD